MNGRDRWNDHAIDGVVERVRDAENELVPLRPIPDRVAQHDRRFDRMREDFLRAEQQEIRRFEAVHRRLDELGAKMDRRFDQVDQDHAAAKKAAEAIPKKVNGINWPSFVATFIAAGAGIGAPIAAAIIAAS